MRVGYIRNSLKQKLLDLPMNIMISKVKESNVQDIIIEIDAYKNGDYQTKLLKGINAMNEKDTLVITTLDELGNNLVDIINIIRLLDEKKINLQVIDNHYFNIDIDNNEDKTLMKQLLAVLTWTEEKERNEIRLRQAKGMNLARIKNDIKLGRPKKYSDNAQNIEDREVYFNVISMLDEGIPITRISEALNISRNTIYTIKEEREKRNQ